MAFNGYIEIKGQQQGQFKGEAIQAERKDIWIPILSFSMGMQVPHDIATGQPSGKRQFDTVTIVKEWGAASPQALTACSTNELLTDVSIEFTKTDPGSQETVFQKLILANAAFTQVIRFSGKPEDAGGTPSSGSSALALERWSFTFQKIEVDDIGATTTFTDTWAATM